MADEKIYKVKNKTTGVEFEFTAEEVNRLDDKANFEVSSISKASNTDEFGGFADNPIAKDEEKAHPESSLVKAVEPTVTQKESVAKEEVALELRAANEEAVNADADADVKVVKTETGAKTVEKKDAPKK
jgi:hypothetical protein